MEVYDLPETIFPVDVVLCLDETDFFKVLELKGMPEQYFVSSNATTHVFARKGDGKNSVIFVCIDVAGAVEHNISLTQLRGILVHEIVHVWQQVKELIGEETEGHECAAYYQHYVFQSFVGPMEDYYNKLSSE